MYYLTNLINKNLKELKGKNLFIKPKIIEGPIQNSVQISGKKYLNFSSNNYLGLANNIKLRKAAITAINSFGVGPAAVRTISGSLTLHQKLERKLAKFKKVQECITFQTGYLANLAVLGTLADKDTVIFSDELNHASIIDGCRLSKAQVVKYNHLDLKDLESKVKKLKNVKVKIIITDGVFSMDGDIAPLGELSKIAKKYDSLLIVDDAHGEGVLGSHGRGIVDHFKLHGLVDLEIGTMSKAMGVIGGMVCGKKIYIDYLRQRARPFLFSSAMTIPDVAACIEAVNILSKSDSLVKKLWSNGVYLKTGLKKFGFDIGNSQTPIVPLMIGNEKKTKDLVKFLYNDFIFTTAITYPTVPLGKARIRLMPSTLHSKNDLDYLINKIKKLLNRA